MSSNTENKVIHLSGLNGIRSIAALAVVISHTTQSLGLFNLNAFIFGAMPEGGARGLDLAGFGVSMFFSLSGFLITYLLLLEKAKQPISIKNFYIRRILRIHPLYYSYLAICLFILIIFQIKFSTVSLFYYIFFAANVPFILDTALPLVAHYWSLGVEEQFYIFYPWIVKKINRLPLFLIIVTLLLIGLKLVFRVIDIKYGVSLPYQLLNVTRFQCMLIGAIGAIYFYNSHQLFIKFSTFLLTQIASWFVIILILLNHFHIASVIDQEIVSTVTVFIILGQITRKNYIFNLDLEVFDFLGKISYGIYVVHPAIIFLCPKSITDNNLPLTVKYLSVYIVIMGITILVAYLSFEYFEKRFLAFKQKFSAIKSAGSKHTESVS